MRKSLIILIIAVFTSGVYTLVAGEKYSEIKKLLGLQKEALEKLLKDEGSIKDGKSAAAVLNQFTEDMKALIPLIVEVAKKYPYVKEIFAGNPPEELKPQMDELKEMGKRMKKTFGKIMQFGRDPAVQEAQKGMMQLQIEITRILNGPEQEKKG